MLRLLRPLTTLLGFVLLMANAASALAVASAENRTSGSATVAEHLVGNNTRLSEEAIRENITLRYDSAPDSPVAARGAAGAEKAAVAGKRTFSTADRAAGLEKAKDAAGVPRCQYCGSKLDPKSGRPNSYEPDHTTPYSRGGPSTQENLTPSCRTCNRSKGAQTPEEWGGP
jgi:5-methylcytosine-specific restriction endonuclease McrA